MQLLTDHDLYLFNEGRHLRLYQKLGFKKLKIVYKAAEVAYA